MDRAADAAFMRRALELARRGRGMTHPNPLVGAVIVRDGVVVGEGWHREYGGPHAEVDALAAAGDARGATMYVSLEPCSHHGKTPPCTDAIIAAGIARVVFAAADTDRDAAGGAARLRDAGIAVTAGVEAGAARLQNRQFFHVRETATPFVALKLAITLDGGIAARPGERTQLTGAAALEETHRLRAEHEAVLVGSGTATIDDPLLTVRGVPCRQPPVRVVLDSGARLSVSSRLVATREAAPVWVVCSVAADSGATAALEGAGVRVLRVPAAAGGLDLGAAVHALGAAGLRSVMVEGGGRIASAMLRQGLLHRLHLFVAPRVLGAGAVPGLREAVTGWRTTAVERLGDDALLTLDPAAAPVEAT